MAYLMVDDVRVSYHVRGHGPLCLIHPGGPGLHWTYLRIPRLEQQLTMVYLEPVGTGDSDLLPDGDYSMEKYAYVVDEIVRHLDADKVFVLGHSHGGFVALQTALDYPHRLRGLIVYSSMAYTGREQGALTLRAIETYVAGRPAGDPVSAQVLAAWKEVAHGREAQLDRLARLLPLYVKDYEGMQAGLDDWKKTVDLTVDPNRNWRHWDIRGRLDEIAVPTLVIAGTADFICPENSGRHLAEGIPGAELVVLKESGHLGHLEEPEMFQDAVVRFTLGH